MSFRIKHALILSCSVLFIVLTQINIIPSLFGPKPGRHADAPPPPKPANKTELLLSQAEQAKSGRIFSVETSDVSLVVVVSSAPSRRARRDAIRNSYWKYCHNDTKIRCFFFTDGNVTQDVLTSLKQENRANKDMVLQPLKGGREFGLRFLYQIKWAFSRFNFTYFLRADDDYFICLDRLKHELAYRPRRNLVWGYYHCQPDLVYVDESWMIFTRDIIEQFLSQNESTVLCHPHADQQIAIWLNDIPSGVYFDDERLHHHPRASLSKLFQKATKVCDRYLGIHGVYDRLMPVLHRTSNDGPNKVIVNFTDYRSICPYWGFDWTNMDEKFRYRPQPCSSRPSWSDDDERIWKGGQDGQTK